MKRSTCIIVSIVMVMLLQAQPNTNDSLRMLLVSATSDTTKVNLLNKLSFSFAESKPDSNLFYGNQALDLARKINYEKGEIQALLNSSPGLTLFANIPKALENALLALKKSEAIKDDRLIANAYFIIAVIYSIQEDYKTSVPYGIKALELYERLHDSLYIITSFGNTGVSYKELNMFDSARILFNKALNLSILLKDEENAAATYLNLGHIALKMKQYDLGMSYCRLALSYYKKTKNHLFLSSIYNITSDLFDAMGYNDSAFYYNRLSLDHANEMGSPKMLWFATKQRSGLFRKSSRFDSAFMYQEMAMNAKDSLTNQAKRKQVEALTYNEQNRQIEIAKQKEETALDRRRNLELAGIAIFIPVFFFVVLWLGRKKVKSRTVEFLGVLVLLFLFEFIVLFAHPYIGHWTHESPVWMLLILVAIAGILIPLHHRSESWMKKKLASKTESQFQPEKV